MANYITLGFNILCIVLLVTGLFWGLIRGLNKTVSRFVFLLILGIALLFLTIPITNALLNIKISTSFIAEEGEVVRQVPIVEFLSILMEGFVGKDFVIKYPEFSELIIALPLTLVYVIVFIVLFWTLKLLLLPLNALITRLIFNRRPRKEQLGFSAYGDGVEYPNSDSSIEPLMEVYKNAETAPEVTNDNNTTALAKTKEPTTQKQVEKPKSKKQLKKEQKEFEKENKPKKHRLLGGLVGIFVGIMLIFFTMVPFYGVISIADNIKGTKLNNITEEPVSLNDLTSGILVDVVKGYDLSAIGRISKALSIDKLGISTFDHLTTVKIKDNNITLREDINSIVNTIVSADTLIGKFKTASDNGLENLTQEELTALINSTDEVITACSEIKFVNAMTDYILPMTYEILKSNDIKFVENEQLNLLILEMISDLADEAGINIFTELRSVVEIAKYVNNQGLLHPLVTGNTDNILNVFDNLDEDFGTQLSNKLFGIKAVDTVFPQMLNIGLKFFDNVTDFGYVENNATKAELKASMSQLITSIVDTARSLSYDSSIYLTDSSIVELGKVLDTFRNSKLFNVETYNNLIDYTMNQVKTMTTDVVSENFTDVFNNKLLRNVGEVESWQTEMKIIHDTLQILRDNENGILGEVVDGQELRVGYSAEFELTEGRLINLGKALDTLEKSVLLGSNGKITHNDTDYTNTTLVALFSSTLNEIYSTVSKEEGSTVEIFDIINNMNDNLILSSHTYTYGSTYWEDELTAIAPLIIEIYNIEESEEFEISAELGTKLDACAHNSIMLGGDTTLILMEKLMAVVQDGVLGENFAPVGDGSMNDKLYNIFVSMRSNLLSESILDELTSDENFWEKEIDCISSLSDIADKASSITSISSAMTIAEDLDKVYSSRIIPVNELNDTLATVLRQLKTTSTTGIDGKINTLIEEIATDITSSTFWSDKDKNNFWTIELGSIDKLTNIKFEDDGEYKVVDNLSTIGADIDDIVYGDGTTRASYLITENRIRDILSFVVSDMSTSIADGFEDGDLKTTITSTLNTIATNLYDNTQDEQVEITSFERELGNLSKLANLDIGSDLFVYTNNPTQLEALENKLANIGSSLDSIAYNTVNTSESTSYFEDINSNIITRPMIANIISSAFSTAKIVGTTEDPLNKTEIAFNTLIENVQTSIINITTDNKVMSWQRELSYVSTLIQLNSGEEFTLENAATDLGSNIDKIAFNHKNNVFLDVTYNLNNNIIGKYVVKEIDDTDPNNIVTTYYNSVIITRDILKTAVDAMVAEFKIAEPTKQQEIANELIDNLSTRVATTTYNTNIYNDYETALTDLNSVKTTMETTADSMKDITVENFSDEHITTIDNMLDTVESKIICGTTTTRNIAVMLVEDFKITSPTTNEEQIINEIIDNLISNINNGLVSDYAVVFTELKDIQNEMTAIKTKFEDKELVSFSEEEFIEIDQMLDSFQDKSICGTSTTRKIAKLMMEKAKNSLTDNGTNDTIMSTEVGTYLENQINYYSTSTAEKEVYYSTATSETYANPMATLYEKLSDLGHLNP